MFMCVVNLESVNKLDLTWKQSFLIKWSPAHERQKRTDLTLPRWFNFFCLNHLGKVLIWISSINYYQHYQMSLKIYQILPNSWQVLLLLRSAKNTKQSIVSLCLKALRLLLGSKDVRQKGSDLWWPGWPRNCSCLSLQVQRMVGVLHWHGKLNFNTLVGTNEWNSMFFNYWL